jgi:hypothetical protein
MTASLARAALPRALLEGLAVAFVFGFGARVAAIVAGMALPGAAVDAALLLVFAAVAGVAAWQLPALPGPVLSGASAVARLPGYVVAALVALSLAAALFADPLQRTLQAHAHAVAADAQGLDRLQLTFGELVAHGAETFDCPRALAAVDHWPPATSVGALGKRALLAALYRAQALDADPGFSTGCIDADGLALRLTDLQQLARAEHDRLSAVPFANEALLRRLRDGIAVTDAEWCQWHAASVAERGACPVARVR